MRLATSGGTGAFERDARADLTAKGMIFVKPDSAPFTELCVAPGSIGSGAPALARKPGADWNTMSENWGRTMTHEKRNRPERIRSRKTVCARLERAIALAAEVPGAILILGRSCRCCSSVWSSDTLCSSLWCGRTNWPPCCFFGSACWARRWPNTKASRCGLPLSSA